MLGLKVLLSLCLLLVLLSSSCHSMKRRRNRRPQPKGFGPPSRGFGPPRGRKPPKNTGRCQFYQSFDGTVAQSSDYFSSFGTVQWVSDLTGLTEGGACSRQGVLKITPSSKTNNIEISIGLENPLQWSFNIGDDPTNNGWGGGSSGSDYVAEVHNIGDRLVINRNKVNGPVTRDNTANFFSVIPDDTRFDYRFSVDRCENVEMSTVPADAATDVSLSGDSYFEFDDLYVGMNRVIDLTSFSDRVGAGGCDICVRFSPKRCFAAESEAGPDK